MRKQNNIRVLELLKYLYLRTDEKHPATIADMLDYLKGKGSHIAKDTLTAFQYFSKICQKGN